MAEWNHRIDAVPEVGRAVEVEFKSWGIRNAVVVEARKPLRFNGVGGHVEYRMGGLRAHAGEVTRWRYPEEPQTDLNHIDC